MPHYDNGEFIYVSFLGQEAPEEFEAKSILHHITLSGGWFETRESVAREVLGILASSSKRFAVRLDALVELGMDKRNPVGAFIVKPDHLLKAIHGSIVEELNKRNVPIKSPYILGEYRPHITKQPHEDPLQLGQSVIVGDISLLWRKQRGDPIQRVSQRYLE